MASAENMDPQAYAAEYKSILPTLTTLIIIIHWLQIVLLLT